MKDKNPIFYIVYRYFDADDNLLYVGQTHSFFARLHAHERNSSWFGLVASVTLERFETEAEMKAAEIVAIRNEESLYNKADNPNYESLQDHFQKIKSALFDKYEYANRDLEKTGHALLLEKMFYLRKEVREVRKSASWAALYFRVAYSRLDKSEFECNNCEALWRHSTYKNYADHAYQQLEEREAREANND